MRGKALKKSLSLLLTMVMMFLIFPVQSAFADPLPNATETAMEITAYNPNFTASVSDDTVTVTGTVTNATSALTINIPDDVTVVWDATFSGAFETGAGHLLNLTGTGSFTLASGGSISAGDSNYYVNGIQSTGVALKIQGSVESNNVAISTSASITVDGGQVSGKFGILIQDGATATVKSGSVLGKISGIWSAEGSGCHVVMEGGSVQSISNALVDITSDGSIPVYCVPVTVTPPGVYDLTVGTYAATTDAYGKAYIWLPAGTASINAVGSGADVLGLTASQSFETEASKTNTEVQLAATNAEAETLATAIRAYSSDSPFTVVTSGKTVTVTGNIATAASILELTIPAGISVEWDAIFSCPASSGLPYLLKLTGAGSFMVPKDGSVSSAVDTAAAAIKSIGVSLRVEGSVTSLTTGIETDSAVTVAGGAITAGTNAIHTTDSHAVITVTAGTVATTQSGTFTTVWAATGSQVIIKGGSLQSVDGVPPTNGTEAVYCVPVNVLPADVYTLTSGSYTATTGADGKAWIWLPAGSASIAAENSSRSGSASVTVSSTDTNAAVELALYTPVETLANTLTLAGFTTAVSGSTVTVTGTKIAKDPLSLTILTGVKVLWNASLTGATDDALVSLNGGGTFELAGGEITNTGTGMAVDGLGGSMVISGGTASSSSNVATVMTYNNMGSNPMTLTMTGGMVTSTSTNVWSSAISAGGNTVITGGTVTVASGYQVFLNNAVVVYRSGLLTAIASSSVSASVAVAPSKTYATPTETAGLTATGYSAATGNVTAKWAVLYSGEGTGVWVDYTYNGTGSGSWRVSYPAVQVVSGRHLLSYRANGGTGATPVSTVYYGQSYTVSTNVFTRTNYTFTGWNTEADGKGTPYAVGAPLIGGPGSDDILLYAQWSPTGGGSNPGSTGGGGGGVSTPTTTAPTASGATATTTVTAQTGTNGTATASVTQSQVTSAIEKAQAAAKSSGEAPSVEIHVSGGSNANAVQTTIPKAAVQAMVSGKMDSLTLSGPVAAMTFDAQAISAIAGAASGDVAFASSKVDNSSLSNAARQTVGNHPVYNFSVTSGGSTISQFGGAVTVSVPYTPAAGENPDAIVAYYINANGEPELMQNCHYDAQTGTLVFTTTHFSTYAVGYHKVAFSDVAEDAWCYDAVTFLAARGITGGTTETAFNPHATLTRGQFLTLVMRAYGIEPDESTADNFSDAGDTYYTGYLAAAKRLGISSGVGGNKFAPKQAVSRQQMFTLLYNALKAIDQLPEGDSGKMLSDFTDSANISSYAQEAMESLVKSGAVSGSNGNLRPTATTTRAQMAQVLYNLLRK